jgi:hypothetical protein
MVIKKITKITIQTNGRVPSPRLRVSAVNPRFVLLKAPVRIAVYAAVSSQAGKSLNCDFFDLCDCVIQNDIHEYQKNHKNHSPDKW